MAISNTTRFGLPQWTEGTDPRPGRVDTNTYLKAIEDKAAMFVTTAPLADRPSPGIEGRLFAASDQGAAGRLYYDTGSSWIETGSVGGGGAGKNVVIAGTATEGVSNRSARADHTHNIPLATASNHGALSSEWAEMLAGATANISNGALIRRTSVGHVYLPETGQGAFDAIHKAYVDNATELVRNATSSPTSNALARRSSSGTIQVNVGTSGYDAANKSYVDNKTWSADDITSGTLSYYRVDGSRHAYYTAWGGSGSIRAVHVTSSGEFCYYSSTRKHKTNISLWAPDPRKLLAVEPSKFDRIDPRTGKITNPNEIGVIAEQAGESVPEFLDLDINEDGTSEIAGWNYLNWSVAHQVVLRWLTKRVDELELFVDTQDEQILDLEVRVEGLEAKNIELEKKLASRDADVAELRKYYNDLAERVLFLEDPNA